MDYDQLNKLCSEDQTLNASTTTPIASEAQRRAECDARLKKNLQALALRSPSAAKAIAQAKPHNGAQFMETDEGVISLELDGMALASKRKPMHEAKRLAQRVEPQEVACCALLGFGIGYHAAALLERLGALGVVVCFEPDVELLCSVLGQVDYSAMFATGRFFLATDPNDSATLTQMFSGIEAVVGLGVEIVSHPPSAKRLGDASNQFNASFGNVLKAARTQVVTTLANARVSFGNAMMNLDHYASSAGIASLKDSCAGKAAVVVSAGPSLERNLHLLGQPGVRDSVVIIAVQTVLKTMLKRGVRPHFVAALDYHELSKRFYEGLTASDVEGIRLIAEPKANPAILDAFPGEVLCVQDELLDQLLGKELQRDLGTVPMGSTVAHLCYYFGRYLGCDPVIFVGQDLGFTDGQYYAAGAAIHQVWAGELSAHNTLEMMEWQRIVRMKGLLRKKKDVHGRSIYADEQMSTYLAQFESAFAHDAQRGLRVIDASEGGVLKQHTQVLTLQEALALHACAEPFEVKATAHLRNDRPERSARVVDRVETIRDDCTRIVSLSNESITILEKMLTQQSNQRELNASIAKVQGVRDRVVKMGAAFTLTEAVNQVGVLNRMKRDRKIQVDQGASALDRQRMQIERDIVNVQWIRDAAESVAALLSDGREAFLGNAPKQTNDVRVKQSLEALVIDEESLTDSSRDCVHAIVLADPDFGGLGNRRDLSQVIDQGMNSLQITLDRLSQCDELDGITIVTPDPDAIAKLISSKTSSKPTQIVGVDSQRFRQRASRVGSARVQSSECWRGSIGMVCVYDEQLDPMLVSQVMNAHSIDACAIVGADWVMIDPDLVDQTVSRYRTQDAEKRIAFSQAVPGLGTMVVDRVTMDSLAQTLCESEASSRTRENHFATMGALVGYIPIAPQFDPIGKGMCVTVDPSVRDAGVRMIADTPTRVTIMRDAFEEMRREQTRIDDAGQPSGDRLVKWFKNASKQYSRIAPRTIVLETCTGRLASGDWGIWKRNAIEPVERSVLTISQAHLLFKEFASLRSDGAVVFDGAGDPLMHPESIAFAQLAKEDGVACVEMRTDLLREGVDATSLVESGIDILSVDLLAERRETYAALTSLDRLEEVYQRVQGIFDEFANADSQSSVWFVPRMTKCDGAYEEVEAFYDKWIMLCGSAIIDPLPQRIANQRIQRLPIPMGRQYQMDRSTMYIRSDGVVVDRIGRVIGSTTNPINAFDEGVERAYQRMCSAMSCSSTELKSNTLEQLIEEHAA